MDYVYKSIKHVHTSFYLGCMKLNSLDIFWNSEITFTTDSSKHWNHMVVFRTTRQSDKLMEKNGGLVKGNPLENFWMVVSTLEEWVVLLLMVQKSPVEGKVVYPIIYEGFYTSI